MTAKLTAFYIESIWQKNSIFFDDTIGTSEAYFNIFIDGINPVNSIQKLIEHFSPLLRKKSPFFENNDYYWCFDVKKIAFRSITEAALQFRLLQLLINLSSVRDIKIEPIIIRQAFTPGASLAPRATYIDQLSFIVFPLGWASQMQLVAAAVEALNNQDIKMCQSYISAFCVNIISEEVVYNYFENNHHTNISAVNFTLLYQNVSNDLIDAHHLFKDAVIDIGKETDTLFAAIIYGCEAFTIAHEAAHIIFNDHKASALLANELSADDLAFDLLDISRHEDLLPDVGISLELKPVFSAMAFLLVGNASILAHSQLEFNATKVEEMRKRTFNLMTKINLMNIKGDDEKKLKYFDYLTEVFLKLLKVHIQEIIAYKKELLEIGQAKLDEEIVRMMGKK